ncbi:MAG TPA: DUF805 domain-containing protein [Rhizobiales bacterium]|nr:DUF805 domain-containing protein [Hyphomicrobiales bacterium]
MRGDVIQYDDDLGVGFIQGGDGRRYAFEKGDLRRLAPLTKGTTVEFHAVGDRAREIFVVRASQRPAPAPSRFGRFAVAEPAASTTGLWSYFVRGLTANYASFRGRARRKEYWGFYLFWLLAVVLLAFAGAVVDTMVGNMDADPPRMIATMVLPGLFVLATIVPGIAITVRRIHDIGLSGWFYLLILVPWVGGLIIFVFSLIPSQKYENKWGPVPEGISVPEPVALSPPVT